MAFLDVVLFNAGVVDGFGELPKVFEPVPILAQPKPLLLGCDVVTLLFQCGRAVLGKKRVCGEVFFISVVSPLGSVAHGFLVVGSG